MEYCPTGDMIADYFTKLLQGCAFKKMVKLIMNLSKDDMNTPPQEYVEKSGQTGLDGIADRRTKNPGPLDGTSDQDHVNMAMAHPSYAEVVKNGKVGKLTFSEKQRL